MTADEQVQRLAAALRAQASGFPAAPPIPASGSLPEHEQVSPPPERRAAQGRSGLPVRVVLVLAVLLGATAGGLAGVISAW
ncbi:MAG TPA: hypothetical protein VGJ13_08400 [Pseudonocardiaceae bacterium]